jgi:hypothetical protein
LAADPTPGVDKPAASIGSEDLGLSVITIIIAVSAKMRPPGQRHKNESTQLPDNSFEKVKNQNRLNKCHHVDAASKDPK